MGIAPTQTPNPLFKTPDFATFIQRRLRDISANINSCLIGTVNAINANGTINASVNFQKIIRGIVNLPNNPIGGDQIINYPILVNVPVFVYQGGGAYIQMPIVVGDTCLLLFCDRDMDTWFENNGQVAPPNSDRVHSLNDAIAMVGINNLADQFPPNNSGLINIVDQTGERLAQSGMMVAYAGATAPAGWLLCQGQSLSRTTYSFLFAAIGTTYGSVDSSHFNIPNMQGQVAAGIGGTLGLTLGQEFGEVNHTLTILEMPAHTHGIGENVSEVAGGGTSFNLVDPLSSIQSTSTGGGDAHNNIQPSLGVNWIIKI